MTQNRTRTFLFVATILWVLTGVPGVLVALGSVFMFDAPGSTEHPITIVLFSSVASFPLVCLLAIAAAWILYALHLKRLACWVACLPALNVIVGIVALICLEVFQGGSF
jgi:hypothetical protein